MGAFSRLRYIITANVNSLLEKAEDPNKLLKALIREMEDARTEARQSLSQMLTEVKVLESSAQRLERKIATLTATAEQHLSTENEAAARQSLQEKSVYQRQLAEQQRQLSTLKDRIGSIEADIKTLQERYQQALELQKNWRNKNRPTPDADNSAPQSRGQQRMQRTLNRFEHLQQQVENLEARVAAENEAYSYFSASRATTASSDNELEIEAELESMKKNLQAQTAKAVNS